MNPEAPHQVYEAFRAEMNLRIYVYTKYLHIVRERFRIRMFEEDLF